MGAGSRELVADLVELLLRHAEFADADGAAEDDQREEEAEERHHAVVACALHLPHAPRS